MYCAAPYIGSSELFGALAWRLNAVPASQRAGLRSGWGARSARTRTRSSVFNWALFSCTDDMLDEEACGRGAFYDALHSVLLDGRAPGDFDDALYVAIGLLRLPTGDSAASSAVSRALAEFLPKINSRVMASSFLRHALGSCSPAVLPGLVDQLIDFVDEQADPQEIEPSSRCLAEQLCARLSASDLKPRLSRWLTHEQRLVRRLALTLVARTAGTLESPEALVGRVMECLKSAHPAERRDALLAAGSLCQTSALALFAADPILRQLAAGEDSSQDVAWWIYCEAAIAAGHWTRTALHGPVIPVG
jgi:hypothetical protein